MYILNKYDAFYNKSGGDCDDNIVLMLMSNVHAQIRQNKNLSGV